MFWGKNKNYLSNEKGLIIIFVLYNVAKYCMDYVIDRSYDNRSNKKEKKNNTYPPKYKFDSKFKKEKKDYIKKLKKKKKIMVKKKKKKKN